MNITDLKGKKLSEDIFNLLVMKVRFPLEFALRFYIVQHKIIYSKVKNISFIKAVNYNQKMHIINKIVSKK